MEGYSNIPIAESMSWSHRLRQSDWNIGAQSALDTPI